MLHVESRGVIHRPARKRDAEIPLESGFCQVSGATAERVSRLEGDEPLWNQSSIVLAQRLTKLFSKTPDAEGAQDGGDDGQS